MAKLKKTKKSNKADATSFDFQALAKNFNSLDPQNMGAWPLVVKLTIAALIAATILALAYAFPIQTKMDDIKTAEKEEQSLLDSYREKESKARNLENYRAQILQMESTFAQLLDQLPKETRIPDLVEDINMRGVGSGVQFKDIAVDSEVSRELFIEQPINILSAGDYHEFGNFVSGVASLSRIITMHDFSIENKATNQLNELPSLEMQMSAKTYRSKDQQSAGDKDNKEGKK